MIAAATDASAGMAIEWFTGEATALPFPDGTVLAVTNGQHTMPHITTLWHDMLAHFGLPVPPLPAATFSIENAPGNLCAVYPTVEETILSSAFVFTDAAPIVRYVMTMMAVQQMAETPNLLADIHDWLTTEATRRLAAMGGTWRDPKNVGLYRCRIG
jgi:hypothetical protein